MNTLLNPVFLILLALFVWLLEQALSHYKAGAWGWAIAYGLVDLLLLVEVFLLLGVGR